MVSIWQVLSLAVMEGVTEFLPVSSTGHLVLASSILGVEQTEFVKSFEIAIQLGAILAAAVLYAKKLWLNKRLLKLVWLSFLPSAAAGLVLYKFIKGVLIGNTGVTLWALFIGGVVLIIWEKRKKSSLRATKGSLPAGRHGVAISGIAASPAYRRTPRNDVSGLTTYSALKIGLFQSISMIPGVSRAGATIIGGMAAGLSRAAAVEFSFLLAIPTMAAATGLDLIKSGWGFSNGEFGLMGIGFIGSFLVAAATVKWLTGFVKLRTLAIFGWYRILVAILWWSYLASFRATPSDGGAWESFR